MGKANTTLVCLYTHTFSSAISWVSSEKNVKPYCFIPMGLYSAQKTN
jgi:hypothetical protein